MAVTSCTFIPEGWTGSQEIKDGSSYAILHRICCNDSSDGPKTAIDGGKVIGPDTLPLTFQVYRIGNDVDLGAVMKRRSILRRESTHAGCNWYIQSFFEPPGELEEGDIDDNPVARPAKYWLEWAHDMTETKEDVHGNKILNKCRRPYPEPVEVPIQIPVLCARRNLASFGLVLSQAMMYVDAVNANTFWGAPARQAKVESITCAEMESENGVYFYPTVYRIQFNPMTWDIRKTEEGFQHYNQIVDGQPDKLIDAEDDEGNRVSQPVTLKSNGLRQVAGEEPVITPWQCNRIVSFAQLLI